MVFPVFVTLLLIMAPFGNVFGEGDEKERVNYATFKMLRDFDQKILQPLAKFCPAEIFDVNVESIDKTRPKWILRVPVNSLDEALANFIDEIKEEKLDELKLKENKWFNFITAFFNTNVEEPEHEQEKWNKLKTLYQTLIDKFRKEIVVHMTKDYIYDYSLNIIRKGRVNLNIHWEKNFKAMEKSELKKRFISKVADLKKEKELEEKAEIIHEIRAIALEIGEKYKGDIEELEFLLQLFVANMGVCAKNLKIKKFQKIATDWPIWKENRVDG